MAKQQEFKDVDISGTNEIAEKVEASKKRSAKPKVDSKATPDVDSRATDEVETETSDDDNNSDSNFETEKRTDDDSKKQSRELFEIIEWYKLNAEFLGPQDLLVLMQKRAKLAAYSVDYAKAILKFSKEFARYHVERSINVKVRATELQSKVDPDSANSKTYTNSRSNEIATIENADCYRLEYLAQANRDGHSLILRTVNGVLDSMKQDIAELRAIRNDGDKTAGDVR